MAVWACKIIILKERKFIRTALDWPALSFLLCITIASLTSVHVHTSLVGFYGRYEGLSTWYLYGLLFFVAANFIRSFEQVKRTMAVLVPTATLMAIYSIIQRHSWDPYMWGGVVTWQRVIGTIGQPNFMAAYMLMAFFIILALFLLDDRPENQPIDWGKQWLPLASLMAVQGIFLLMIYNLDANNVVIWYLAFLAMSSASVVFAYYYADIHPLILKILLGLVLLLVYIALLYTQSRGGYMGFFTGIVLFALLIGRRWLFSHYKKFAALSILIVLVSAITMLQPEFSPLQRFTSEVSTTKSSEIEENAAKLELKGAAGSRTETWTSAFKIVADNPLFGIGPEVLKMVFPRYETDLFRFKEAFHVKQDRCHNETMDVSITKGLLAFIVYIWLLYIVFKVGISKINRVNSKEHLVIAGLLAAAVSYLVQNQFSFGVVAITSLFWVIWALVMIVGENREIKEKKAISLNWKEIPWLPVAGIIAAAVIAIYISFASFRGDIWFKSGKTKLDYRQVPQAIEDLQKSLKFYPLEGGTVSHLGIAQLNSSFQNANQVNDAISILKYGTQVDPYNADNYFILAKIFLNFGMQNNPTALAEAQKDAEIALKIDPYYAEVYLLLGVIYEKKGNLNEAAKLFEEAFFINPTLAEPMQRMQDAYAKLGRPTETLAVLQRALNKYSDNLLIMDRVGRIYLLSGNKNDALNISNKMIAVNPKDPAGYILRAEIYLAQGNADRAFKDLQQVVFNDPKNTIAHNGLGNVYLMRGERQRAKEEFEQVIMLDPNNAYAKNMLEKLK
ncbi:MAG: tetratricopeptide repeat protein [Candidatus Margulisbacteria bacterium]|nr:tetratricopeptide repeat protein [Candidatus Margulisiibacteriota bacterium]